MDNIKQSKNRLIIEAIEKQSYEFLHRALECDSNLNVYAKLYAANKVMASAMRTEQVASALVEICSNLLGCEEMAIVEIECETEMLRILVADGVSQHKCNALIESAPVLQSLIDPGVAVIASCAPPDTCLLCELGISAIVPLWIDARSSVALVLFQLLPQRDGFDEEDRTILQLLSIYAGPCLRSQTRD